MMRTPSSGNRFFAPGLPCDAGDVRRPTDAPVVGLSDSSHADPPDSSTSLLCWPSRGAGLRIRHQRPSERMGAPGYRNASGLRVVDLREVVTGVKLRVVVHNLVNGVVRADEQARHLALRHGLLLGPGHEPRQPEVPLELLLALHALLPKGRSEAGVFQKLRHTNGRDGQGPSLASAGDGDVAVLAGVVALGIAAAGARPAPPPSLAVVLVVHQAGQPSVDGGHLRLQYGHVHTLTAHALVPLAVPCEEGGHRRVVSGLVLDVAAAQLQGIPLRQAEGVHPAAHPKQRKLRCLVVAVWAGLPEVGQGGHNQVGVDGLECVVVQAEAGHDAGTEALHQDVGVLHQLLQRLYALV